jgi:hypothetical protein
MGDDAVKDAQDWDLDLHLSADARHRLSKAYLLDICQPKSGVRVGFEHVRLPIIQPKGGFGTMFRHWGVRPGRYSAR